MFINISADSNPNNIHTYLHKSYSLFLYSVDLVYLAFHPIAEVDLVCHLHLNIPT